MPPNLKKNQDKPEPFLPIDMRATTNIAYHLCNVHGMCLLPFLRTGMGKRGIGLAGFFSFLLIWLYGGFADAPEMLAYSYAWLSAVVYRRLTADPEQHTQYQGWPMLTGWLVKDEVTARLAEAGLMCVAGGILSGLSPALGRFVGFGTVSLGVKYLIDSAMIERQQEAAHNAVVEMGLHQQRMEEVTRR